MSTDRRRRRRRPETGPSPSHSPEISKARRSSRRSGVKEVVMWEPSDERWSAKTKFRRI